MILVYAFFIFGVIFLWMIIAWRNIGYIAYLWQVKQYRWDRMISQLREPGGMRLLLNRSVAVKSIFACIALLLGLAWQLGIWFYYAVYALYILEIGRWIAQGAKAKFPVLTAKTLVIVIASFILPLWAIFSLRFLPSIAEFLLWLLIIDIFIPVIVSLAVLILAPFMYAAKQYIVRRAINKRNVLKSLIAIGIGGSVGKTSTKEFLAHILAEKFRVIRTKEHQNTEIGAAKALMRASEDTQVFVAEIGAYRQGDVTEIAHVVKPSIGIITSLGYEHISLFGSLDEILEAEFELAHILDNKGTLIVNADNEYIDKLLQDPSLTCRIVRYSLKKKDAQVYASDITLDTESLAFTVHYKKQAVPLRVNLLGKHNISNILAAIAAALQLGMTLKEITHALTTLTPLPRTMHMKKGINNLIIIDDSYNASSESVNAACEYITLHKDKTRIAIMPSLIELGDKSVAIHEQIGEQLATHFAYAIITDTTYQEALETGWRQAKGKTKRLFFVSTPQDAKNILTRIIDNNSVILIEGRIPGGILRTLSHYEQ